MTEINSRLLNDIEHDPAYTSALTRVRAARETAALLRTMRKEAGLTQMELGKKLGVSQARISHIESGLLDYIVPIDFAYLYANACGFTISLQFAAGRNEHAPRLSSLMAITGTQALGQEALGQGLTSRQSAVLDSVLQGMSNKEIAHELNLMEATVKVHIQAIMSKFNARSRTELAYKVNDLFGVEMPEAASRKENASRLVSFTARQTEILEALRREESNKAIARELNMRESTLKVHIRIIMRKLDVVNRMELAHKVNDLLSGIESREDDDNAHKPAYRS